MPKLSEEEIIKRLERVGSKERRELDRHVRLQLGGPWTEDEDFRMFSKGRAKTPALPEPEPVQPEYYEKPKKRLFIKRLFLYAFVLILGWYLGAMLASLVYLAVEGVGAMNDAPPRE